MFLFLSSLDCLQTQPANNAFDFIIDFPRIIRLEGKWSCALLDVEYNLPYSGDLYIYSDICGGSYVNNNFLPILRRIKDVGSYHNPYFIPVVCKEISQLRIYIRDVHNQVPSVASGELKCTLVLRQLQ